MNIMDLRSLLNLASALRRRNRNLATFAEDEGRWVTIGSNKDAPKGEKGGTPVKLGKGGEIQAGPAKLKGKKVSELHKRAMYDRHTGDYYGKTKGIDLDSVPEHTKGEAIVPSIEHPHEMTSDEYRQARMAHAKMHGLPVQNGVWGIEHEQAVAQAANRGEDIPEEVLSEYPHLVGHAMVAEHKREAKERAEAAKAEKEQEQAGEDVSQEQPAEAAPEVGQEDAEGASEPEQAEPAKPAQGDPKAALHSRVQELKAQGLPTERAVAKARMEAEKAGQIPASQPNPAQTQQTKQPRQLTPELQKAQDEEQQLAQKLRNRQQPKPDDSGPPAGERGEPVQQPAGGSEPAAVQPNGKQAGKVPQPKKGAQSNRVGKSAIERMLLSHLQETGGGYTAQDEQTLNEAAGAGDPFLFHGKLPTEIKEYMQGRPELRRLFRVTNDPGKAGGADAFGALGDKYLDIASRKAGGGMTQALDAAKNSPDPQIRLLAAIHETYQGGPKETVSGADLQPGQEMTVNGIPMEVTENEDGERLLQDGGDLPTVPVDAVDKLPVDRGSIHEKELADLDDPFADVMDEPEQEEVQPEESQPKGRPETHFQGDRAEYTGKSEDGLHEIEMMEGHEKGQKKWTPKAPGEGPGASNESVERNRREWQQQQADYSRLAKAQAAQQASQPAVKPTPSAMKTDLFGKSFIDSSGVGEQGGMFHEPVAYEKPDTSEFKNFKPEDTAEMFPAKGEEPPSQEQPADPRPAKPSESGRGLGGFTPDEMGQRMDWARQRLNRNNQPGRGASAINESLAAIFSNTPTLKSAMKQAAQLRGMKSPETRQFVKSALTQMYDQAEAASLPLGDVNRDDTEYHNNSNRFGGQLARSEARHGKTSSGEDLVPHQQPAPEPHNPAPQSGEGMTPPKSEEPALVEPAEREAEPAKPEPAKTARDLNKNRAAAAARQQSAEEYAQIKDFKGKDRAGLARQSMANIPPGAGRKSSPQGFYKAASRAMQAIGRQSEPKPDRGEVASRVLQGKPVSQQNLSKFPDIQKQVQAPSGPRPHPGPIAASNVGPKLRERVMQLTAGGIKYRDALDQAKRELGLPLTYAADFPDLRRLSNLLQLASAC